MSPSFSRASTSIPVSGASATATPPLSSSLRPTAIPSPHPCRDLQGHCHPPTRLCARPTRSTRPDSGRANGAPSGTATRALGTRLLLRLLAFDPRLFLRFGLGFGRLLAAEHPLGGTAVLLGLGLLTRLRLVAVEDVLLTHGPDVGRDPVDQHTDRHHETEEPEEGQIGRA